MNLKRFREIQRANARLCAAKAEDYGDEDIISFGAKGMLVRLRSKYDRLYNLLWKQRKPNYESAWKTAQDLANYAVMTQLLIEGHYRGGTRKTKEEAPRRATKSSLPIGEKKSSTP